MTCPAAGAATACATEDTFLLTLEKTRLLGLLQNYPEIAIGMLRSLSLRVREANNRMLAMRKNTGDMDSNAG